MGVSMLVSNLIERMTALRVNLMAIPERFGVPQVKTATIVNLESGVEIARAVERCVINKVKPYQVTDLASNLAVGIDDVWCEVPRTVTLEQLNGQTVIHWIIEGIEEVPTKYRVAFIDDRELLTYKVLLNRFYEPR
jgi:hypothetical protein